MRSWIIYYWADSKIELLPTSYSLSTTHSLYSIFNPEYNKVP